MIFSNLRKYTKTIMWIVAIFIVPAFVIWNIGSAVKDRRSGFAGKIFNSKIAMQDFIKEKVAARNDSILRGNEASNDSAELDEQAWTRLIILHKAKQNGIKISNEELFNHIKAMPFFQYAGLNSENYAIIISRIFQQTPSEFESGVRASLMIAKLMEKLTADITVTETDIRDAYEKQNMRASVVYLDVPAESFAGSVPLDDEQKIKDFYEAHKDEFKTQEKVNVKYIEIKFEKFKDKVDISEERISKFYDNNKEKFKRETPPEGENSAEPSNKYKDISEVRDSIIERITEKEMNNLAADTARQIITKLYSDTDFSAIAQEYGMSADETGPFSMLEEIPKIGLSYPFLKAAFSLKTGEISEIIKTPTALYILKPIKRFPPAIPAYEEIKDKVRDAYIKEQSRIMAHEKCVEIKDRIYALIKEGNKTFSEAATELGYKAKESADINNSGYVTELGYAPNFSQAAFMLKPLEISSPVGVPNGFCLIQLKEILPVDNAAYEKEKENFRNSVLLEKRNQLLNSWFENVKKEAKAESYLEQDKQQ